MPITFTTVNKTWMPTKTTFEFNCPLCTTGKGMINHCYSKHPFSLLRGMFIKDTPVETTTERSSEPRLGFPVSGPQ